MKKNDFLELNNYNINEDINLEIEDLNEEELLKRGKFVAILINILFQVYLTDNICIYLIDKMKNSLIHLKFKDDKIPPKISIFLPIYIQES